MFPSDDVVTRHPLPVFPSLPRVAAGALPLVLRYYEGAVTSCLPSRRASQSFAGRYHRVHPLYSLSPGQMRPGKPGLLRPVVLTGNPTMETTGSPTFLRNPCTYALLFDPGRTCASGLLRCAGVVPADTTTRTPTTRTLSRLIHTAWVLAVYASQHGSPHHHARLASGCWPSSSGRA
jgi:hypothetical protein